MSQTIGTDVTRYLWDGDQIIRELDGEGQTRATLVHGLGLGADIGSLVKAERGGQNQFFHYDWRGSVTNLTDQSSTPIQSYLYNAFGEITNSSGTVVNPYQFSGKPYDGNSGFSYFGRRHYSAHLGRFITQDPKEYVDGLNTYAYVKNNPVNLIDLYGLYPDEVKSLIAQLAWTVGEYWEIYREIKQAQLNSDFAHCVEGCNLTKDYGPELASLAGEAKEIADEIWSWIEWWDPSNLGYNLDDLKYDEAGITCGKAGDDCYQCCTDYFKNK